MAEASSPVRAAERLAADLQTIFGRRLHAVVIYGTHARPHLRAVRAPVQTAALVEQVGYADLSACAERAGGWQRAGLEIPLLLPLREFTRSLDAFPLEYGDIIDHHVLVYGEDPFVGQHVVPEDLRRACEVQARGHIIHLREGFLLAGHDATAVARLIAASAGPFAALMDAFTKVTAGPRDATPQMIAAHAEATAGLPASLVERLLTLEEDGGTLDPATATQLYPPYVDVMHALVAFVDDWRDDAGAQVPATSETGSAAPLGDA